MSAPRQGGLRVGSCFAGIGGFDLGLERAGFSVAWQVELDERCQDISRFHWPTVERHADVRTVGASNLAPVDLLVGGFPCQDISVAGRRAGLAGERSGLWWEFHRIARELRPEWVAIENVGGLLSSNGGADLTAILDALEDLGYVCDVEILDSQFFGLAQRRRRVFIVCRLASSVLTDRTECSRLTMVQLLVECCAYVLAAGRERDLAAGGSLRRRMKLFGLDSAGAAQRLLKSLAALRPLSEQGPCCLALEGGVAHFATSGVTRSSGSIASEACVECQSIARSWSDTLAEALNVMSECITSTAGSETTESKIFTCAQMALLTTALITPSTSSLPSYWSAASSASTAMLAYTNYARSASSSVFTEVEWLCRWRHFQRQAALLHQSFGGSGDWRDHCSLLPVAESLPRDSAARREAREAVAATPTRGAESGGRGGYAGRRREDDENLVAGPVLARNGKGPDSDGEGVVACTLTTGSGGGRFDKHPLTVAHTLRAEGHDASEDGTGRGTPLVAALAFNWQSGGDCRINPSEELAGTLQVEQVQAVGFAVNQRREGRLQDVAGAVHEPSGTQMEGVLCAPWTALHAGEASRQVPLGVRRLLPVECERLQGFPDDWTRYGRGLDGTVYELADAPRYRALGNAISVPVAEWIGRRIANFAALRSAA